MPSLRAIVAMRVQAEARLAQDVQMLAEVMDMPAERVPQLLTPRVPHNDPNFRHVKFLQGVSTLVEAFLDHAGIDHEARREEMKEEPEPVAEHQRIEVNPTSGLPPTAPGDPRLTGVGQGLVDPEQVIVQGVVPGMLEGDIGEVKEAVSELGVNDVAMLREMETGRLGGPRQEVLDVLDERSDELKEEAKQPTDDAKATQEVVAERQKQAQEAAAAAAEAAEATSPKADPTTEAVATSQPSRQMPPDRPAAAVRGRLTPRSKRGQ